MSRDLTREDLRKIVQIGLENTNGNYRLLTRLFDMPDEDYKRFLSFLRKHECHLPFKHFRQARVPTAAPSRSNARRQARLAVRPSRCAMTASSARQVMIVDDDRVVLDALDRLLMHWGYTTLPFERFEDARMSLAVQMPGRAHRRYPAWRVQRPAARPSRPADASGPDHRRRLRVRRSRAPKRGREGWRGLPVEAD